MRKLERLRRSLAKKENLSTSQILSDTVLRRIAETRPATEEEFRGVKGIGPKKRTNTRKSFYRPSIRNGAVFPQKQKVKCRKKENISFPKRQNPSADGKGKSQRYERKRFRPDRRRP